MNSQPNSRPVIAIVGGGPAGLMAAETLAAMRTATHAFDIHVYDAMASSGRKFLLAGRGGMNITHAEPYEQFVTRYGARAAQLRPMLDAFGPDAVRAWVHGLGVETFVGTSRRVFPTEMKAAPLLRAWLHRLREGGVHLHQRHRWTGWHEGALRFDTPAGETLVNADAVILALGGASWARLGSDGTWVPLLRERGIDVAPLQPSNCGFDVGWSEHFASRYAGQPLTTVAATWTDSAGQRVRRQGQFVVTATGVEGSLIYAMSAPVRDTIAAHGSAVVELDLLPDLSLQRVLDEVTKPRGSRSMASHLQGRLHVKGVKAGLLHECLSREAYHDPAQLAAGLKALPLTLRAPRPLDEAISSAGGVAFEALDGTMLRALPGVFVAGEMVDWEAPTGGYLLTACLASGVAAGRDVAQWLGHRITL
ncbi:TIGR03862 family flavoprotein [Pseudoduganella plicata]|uniref:NAD(FAD)-utilizing dehydrogenase n=1 Tax=Pseudoduganella plicata TaxID=321984 RepID=A0A4P7BAZ8_9BURK|nr:TIGR03862 family flavoprotein [Pseudoduganella plicata]QBQ35300.1 TIGR03862 family flavoprotein [Pseudoduganella plicata]GGZ00685.1 NAD(FAD)-utilizing dehydrogenase [Pseudoduganella plicata]